MYDNINLMLDTAQLQKYYDKYGKEKVDSAVEYLLYKNAPVLPKEEIPGKPILYVFRHGQTEDNATFTFSGWREPGLTEKGKEQALVLADKLIDKKIDMLISSPQIRAIDTMKLAISKNKEAKNLEIHVEPRIKERHYGIYQGHSKLEIQLENPEKLSQIRRSFDIPPEGGESIKEVCERVGKFCDEIVPLMQENNVSVAVSCHGNSMRGFRRYFENLSDEQTAEIETPLGKDYAAYTIK